jgi:type III pantothenate kinase
MRTLAVAIGNTTIFCGVFVDQRLLASFRLRAAGRGWGRRIAARARGEFGAVAVCSVVPRLTRPIVRELTRHFGLTPRVLTTTAPHGLKIGYRRPRELGTDRLAAALGAREKFPRRNVIVVDCGTATTVTALRRDGALLGGAILPGLALWPAMLAARTAQLPRVPLRRPAAALGRSPPEGIASGIFFGHGGAIRELIGRIRREAFGRGSVVVVGTGGHAPLFAHEGFFTAVEPALILHGLRAFISILE